MTDFLQLRQDIIEELEFDPQLQRRAHWCRRRQRRRDPRRARQQLRGKLAAIAAARRVKSVHAIAENIEVHCPYEKEMADDQIAKRARDILKWDVSVPPDAVDVLVHDGWVTLSGNVNWYFEKTSAEDEFANYRAYAASPT